LAEFLQAEPVHASKERLQLKRQFGGAETEALVLNHHDHGQMEYLGMELQKAEGLSSEPVLELGSGLHLHLEQHHRLLRCADLATPRPEHAIEAVIHRLELRSLKAVERIPRRISPQAGRRCITRQQQRDQIRRALKQAVEPVIRFQSSPSGTTEPSKQSPNSTPALLQAASVLSRIHKRAKAPAVGSLRSTPSQRKAQLQRPLLEAMVAAAGRDAALGEQGLPGGGDGLLFGAV